METGPHESFPFGSSRQLGKVGGGARDDVFFQLEDDAAQFGGGVAAAELEVEVGLGVALLLVNGGCGVLK